MTNSVSQLSKLSWTVPDLIDRQVFPFFFFCLQAGSSAYLELASRMFYYSRVPASRSVSESSPLLGRIWRLYSFMLFVVLGTTFPSPVFVPYTV